jgi:drug/metabolite transporter (DMT)-like permease
MDITMSNSNIVKQRWGAFVALLGCGALVALSTNLAKVAYQQGLAPLPFLTWSLAGATLLLGCVFFSKHQRPLINKKAIKYYFIAGFFSVAGSNLIFFSAVAHVGVSFVALVISLPPILTYVAALMLGMERFNGWRAAGVCFALVGAVILVSAQWSLPETNRLWLLITLIGPVLLASGNIYRTRHWPVGAKAGALAPAMLLAATTTLLLVATITPELSLHVLINIQNSLLIVLQSILFAGQFLLLFVLQRLGGPVFLSLTGAVSTAFAIPFAMLLFDEPMLPTLAPSAIFILVGIVFMMKGQLQNTHKLS